MLVAVTHRRWRPFLAVVQLLLFAFSASTSLLPCANDMATGPSEQLATAHHAAPQSHESHATHDASGTTAAEHTPANHTASGPCPWVVGCSGVVQFTIESSWRLVETTPAVSSPTGLVLRRVYAEREVESPPPRA